MIVERIQNKNLYGDTGEWKVTQYLGEDALKVENPKVIDLIKKYLGKDVRGDKGRKGVVIGWEDNEPFLDYYYIVYYPDKEEVGYELSVWFEDEWEEHQKYITDLLNQKLKRYEENGKTKDSGEHSSNSSSCS